MAYSSAKISGRLVIGDKTEYECVGASLAFELNAVPRASFVIALGRGTGALTPATIHSSKAGLFQNEQKLKFYLTITHMAGIEQDLPTGEFLLFEGYLTGLSFQKQGGSVQAIVQAKHWLLDMDYSSSLSDTSHPTNPGQFSYRTTHLFKGSGSRVAGSWAPFTSQGLITAAVLAEDFWGKGLYLWLKELTEQDAINTTEMAFLGQAGKNDTAAKALARFTLKAGKYVPLKLDFNGIDSSAIAAAIWNDVQAETFASFAETTLWGKLVNDFGSRYMFAVVPRVEDAVVVPFVPGLRTPWKYQLLGHDYTVLGVNSENMRLLRGVGVFSGVGSRTGFGLRESGGNNKRLGVGGWYSPEGVTSGMVMLKQGPRWLTNVVSDDRYSKSSTNGGTAPIGNALHPGKPANASTQPGPDATDPEKLQIQSKKLLDAFAHTLYVYEQLRLRQIEIGGKFRLDIAPGSTVYTDVLSERFIVGDTLGQDVIGNVMRVTHVIDCEGGRMGTNFNISHVRTVNENKDDRFSLTNHPLWTENWLGCGLIKRYD